MPKSEYRIMEIGFKQPNRANRVQLRLKIGTGIFAAGALGFIARYLSQGQVSNSVSSPCQY
jgi:hypothetical protein